MDKITAYIVDDERLAIDVVGQLLNDISEIEIVGTSSKSTEAVKAIIRLKPQLLFLDIQMPGLNGFEVIEQILEVYSPTIIFTTAFDEFAIRAFDVHAVAYLLKPLQRDKFTAAVQRAQESIRNATQETMLLQLRTLLDAELHKPTQLQRIMIKDAKRIVYIPLTDILYFEAAGDYVKVIGENQIHLAQYSMQQLQLELPADQFVRIHRSWIVRIDAVKEFIPYFNGEYYVIMRQGDKLKLSRGYKSAMSPFFQGL